MSKSGQEWAGKQSASPVDDWEAIDNLPRAVVGVAIDYPEGGVVEWHAHRRAQLVYSCSGVLTVWTQNGLWVAPPQRAVWVPAEMPHQVWAKTKSSMRTLYVHPRARPNFPSESCAVSVSALLRELILHVLTRPRLYDVAGPDGRVMDVILDLISALPEGPLPLTMPRDPRLALVCRMLLDHPGDDRSLADWGAIAGASGRTLERLFRAETGMTLHHWRQQARLLASLERIADHQPVATVALDLGFRSQSAFIAMFKKYLGKTPRRYFSS